MKTFSINAKENQVICDTPLCLAEIRHLKLGDTLSGPAQRTAESVLCVASGDVELITQINGQSSTLQLAEMHGAQIPAGGIWRVRVISPQCTILRVDSPHPGHTAAANLMPPLDHVYTFKLDSGASLVYTDYMRGGVLTFAPGFAADKHYHERADELFWFFKGACHVTTADNDAVLPAGTLVYTAPDEWHIIANSANQSLVMFLVVTPNVVPSHTFFDADGGPVVRSWQPLTRMG